MNFKKYDENGLVSIMIASVLMVIMALITLGFTRIVQNEQRQALDAQLSQQAFYAAESGINVAASRPGFPGRQAKTDCDVSGYNAGVIREGVDDVVFTCLLIDPTPRSLEFNNDSITTNRPKIVPINTNEQLSQISFEWRDNSGVGDVSTTCSDVSSLTFAPDAENWGKIAAVKLELIAIPEGNITRGNILANHFSTIFYPCNNSVASEMNYNDATGARRIGRITPVNCAQTSGEYQCRMTINVPEALRSSREFYARFNSVYRNIDVRITGLDIAGNEPLFSNAQAVVDSTGRANDVFRRLQARVPLYDIYPLPNGVLQTLDDICKNYEVQQDRVIDRCLGSASATP